MSEVTDSLAALCTDLQQDGVPKHILHDLLSKIVTGIPNEAAKSGEIADNVSGHVYELMRWRVIIGEKGRAAGYQPLEAKDRADVLYDKSGDVRAVQAKWSTSESTRGAYKNLNKAYSQLGGAEGEVPPANARLIADAVITNLPPERQLGQAELIQKIDQCVVSSGIAGRTVVTKITILGQDYETIRTTYITEGGRTRYLKEKRSYNRLDTGATKNWSEALQKEAEASTPASLRQEISLLARRFQ